MERTDLQWSEEIGKQVLLSQAVTPGALLFLRLLHPTRLDRVHPVPNQADPVIPTEGGQHLVRLVRGESEATES